MVEIDVLLINLAVLDSEKAMMPPLGQMYIATVLKNNGYRVKILDLATVNDKMETVYQYIKHGMPKIVGLSSYYETWNQMFDIAKMTKNVTPNTIVAVGGNGATFSYSEIMDNKCIDYVIRFEGESPFLSLCDYIMRKKGTIEEIGGLVYRRENSIRVNKEQRIAELDELPFPDRDFVDLSKYVYPYTIMTSRGCTGNCIFCSSKSFWKKQVRFRSLQNVIDELKEMRNKYKATSFFLLDDNFTLNNKRVTEFCDMLLAENLEFKWFCEARADSLDEIVLRKMYNSGCRWLQIGLESGNNHVLEMVGKRIKYEDIERVVKCAYMIGFKIKVSVILGHHVDDKSTIQETLDKVRYLVNEYGVEAAWSVNTPFPGTDLFVNQEEYGIQILSKNWVNYRMDNPIINTKNLSVNELRKYLMLIGENINEKIYNA